MTQDITEYMTLIANLHTVHKDSRRDALLAVGTDNGVHYTLGLRRELRDFNCYIALTLGIKDDASGNPSDSEHQDNARHRRDWHDWVSYDENFTQGKELFNALQKKMYDLTQYERDSDMERLKQLTRWGK